MLYKAWTMLLTYYELNLGFLKFFWGHDLDPTCAQINSIEYVSYEFM